MTRLNIFEYAEQHKDCPEKISEYQIDGKQYIVHAHFVGEKDVDTVIRSIAFNRAMNETFSQTAA